MSIMLEGDASVMHISTIDLQGYVAAIGEAFDVYVDREKIRHGMWKQYPTMDQVRQIKLKAERVIHMLEQPEHDPAYAIEEFKDIINYAVFGMRIETGEISG